MQSLAVVKTVSVTGDTVTDRLCNGKKSLKRHKSFNQVANRIFLITLIPIVHGEFLSFLGIY